MLLVPSNMMTDHFEAHICVPCPPPSPPRALPPTRLPASKTPRPPLDAASKLQPLRHVCSKAPRPPLDAASKPLRRVWQAPATKYTDFWIRGQSVSIATVVYCMTKLPEDVAAKAMLGLSAGIAVLYPFNAKFGYLSSLEVKYPMYLFVLSVEMDAINSVSSQTVL